MTERPTRSALLRLYRDLLAHARRFPSKKRAGIVADVRAEWREKRALRDPARVAHAVEVAVTCRQDLQRPEHCGAVADRP